MEGVGARLGRSSTRYGPATVFTGPVRKWKKKWVHVAPSSNTNNASSTTHHSHQINGHNGTSNGNNGSHLLLYKWTPITQSQNTAISNNNNAVTNGNGGDKVSAKDDDALGANEEPPRRKFKYIPIALLEEQQLEAAEQVEDESNSIDNEPTETEATPKNEVLDEKPDINDVPMEENERCTTSLTLMQFQWHALLYGQPLKLLLSLKRS
ncbi:protein kinase 4 isoform X2 [Prunus dulcis]|uniref:protein kinase 4 isoform X2 n=1 Tax=Prunus dulcis TaxID=3755 RepID=UPI001481DCA5|nr:protein kinase 4 isoform X2 [Prunus dulcis]